MNESAYLVDICNLTTLVSLKFLSIFIASLYIMGQHKLKKNLYVTAIYLRKK